MVLPMVYPSRNKLGNDEVLAACHPLEFFNEEILEVVRLLEKYADWRFLRRDGLPVGKMCEECWVAYTNPVIDRMVPSNMHEFVDLPNAIFDRSHGDGEGVTRRMDTLRAWAKLPSTSRNCTEI